ncbi:hypothetical protein Agub_g13547 [Astrephomene gubernaculifera]|uniref:Uncharacterized protein n=1 Tax=Astrephomene gubernaculifera TaxID=47775 RepID=A0AAD3HSQ0_9CHLO|nr:hypothetical protein Agub_g13547 [Astrephomene gubernaculifera]
MPAYHVGSLDAWLDGSAPVGNYGCHTQGRHRASCVSSAARTGTSGVGGDVHEGKSAKSDLAVCSAPAAVAYADYQPTSSAPLSEPQNAPEPASEPPAGLPSTSGITSTCPERLPAVLSSAKRQSLLSLQLRCTSSVPVESLRRLLSESDTANTTTTTTASSAPAGPSSTPTLSFPHHPSPPTSSINTVSAFFLPSTVAADRAAASAVTLSLASSGDDVSSSGSSSCCCPVSASDASSSLYGVWSDRSGSSSLGCGGGGLGSSGSNTLQLCIRGNASSGSSSSFSTLVCSPVDLSPPSVATLAAARTHQDVTAGVARVAAGLGNGGEHTAAVSGSDVSPVVRLGEPVIVTVAPPAFASLHTCVSEQSDATSSLLDSFVPLPKDIFFPSPDAGLGLATCAARNTRPNRPNRLTTDLTNCRQQPDSSTTAQASSDSAAGKADNGSLPVIPSRSEVPSSLLLTSAATEGRREVASLTDAWSVVVEAGSAAMAAGASRAQAGPRQEQETEVETPGPQTLLLQAAEAEAQSRVTAEAGKEEEKKQDDSESRRRGSSRGVSFAELFTTHLVALPGSSQQPSGGDGSRNNTTTNTITNSSSNNNNNNTARGMGYAAGVSNAARGCSGGRSSVLQRSKSLGLDHLPPHQQRNHRSPLYPFACTEEAEADDQGAINENKGNTNDDAGNDDNTSSDDGSADGGGTCGLLGGSPTDGLLPAELSRALFEGTVRRGCPRKNPVLARSASQPVFGGWI